MDYRDDHLRRRKEQESIACPDNVDPVVDRLVVGRDAAELACRGDGVMVAVCHARLLELVFVVVVVDVALIVVERDRSLAQ